MSFSHPSLDAILANTTVQELMANRDPLIVSEETSPTEGFQMLADAHIRACPVVATGSKEIIGTLDLRDTCKFFVELQRSKSSGDEHLTDKGKLEAEDKMVDTPSVMPSTKTGSGKSSKVLNAITHHPTMKASAQGLRYLAKMRPFKVFPPTALLSEIVGPLSQGSHIVGVSGGPDSTSGLSKVVTQGMLFRFVAHELLKCNVKVQNIMHAPVLTVRFDLKAFDAFEIMATKGISGLAVVDADGNILQNTSIRDLKMWVAGESEGSAAPAHMHDDSIEEFLVKLRASEHSSKTRYPVSVCHPDDDVAHAVKMLSSTGYHRVWVVPSNADRRPVGVISLTDVLKKIIS